MFFAVHIQHLIKLRHDMSNWSISLIKLWLNCSIYDKDPVDQAQFLFNSCSSLPQNVSCSHAYGSPCLQLLHLNKLRFVLMFFVRVLLVTSCLRSKNKTTAILTVVFSLELAPGNWFASSFFRLINLTRNSETKWPKQNKWNKHNNQNRTTTMIETSGGWNVMENVEFTSDILLHLRLLKLGAVSQYLIFFPPHEKLKL